MALVYIRPDADVVDGSWINESASNTNLYDSLNETSPIDTDYIRSSNNPANDIVTLRLSNFGAAVTEPMTVHYRYKAVSTSGDPLSLKVRLVQGAGGSPATTVAEWEHSDAAATYQDASQLLTTAQFNAISDFDDLFLEFEAITGALGAQLYAYGLLTGENNGFAIDATVYDVGEEAYIGGPVGGTLAVKGHSTNYTNVALDAAVLTQSGTSAKMVQFPTSPYVRWTPHNLILQSQTHSSASWQKSYGTTTEDIATAPDGTTTADEVVRLASTDVHYWETTPNFTILANTVYTASVYLKLSNGTPFFLMVIHGSTNEHFGAVYNLNAGTVTQTQAGSSGTYISSSITSVGSGWYRLSVTGSTTTTSVRLFFQFVSSGTPTINTGGWENATAGNGTDAFYVWGAQLVRGHNANPYLVTTSTARIGIPLGYDIAQGQYGVLIEPAATNVALNSEACGSWTPEQTSTSANSTTAPDGSSTADTLIEDTANTRHVSYQQLTLASGSTFSIFAKAKERSYLYMTQLDGTHNYHVVFNLNDGTVASTQSDGTPGGSNNIVSVGNGWYRCSVSTTGVTNPYCMVGMNNDATPSYTGTNNSPQYTGDGTSGIYVWGFQVEAGSVATSYIPTLGSTVTRAADRLSLATSAIPFSAIKGTIAFDGKFLGQHNDQRWVALSDGTTDERILMYTSGTRELSVFIADGGVTQVSQQHTVVPNNTLFHFALAWAANDVDHSVNGAELMSEGDSSLPTVTQMDLGHEDGDSNTDATGFIYRLTYVPRQVETEGP